MCDCGERISTRVIWLLLAFLLFFACVAQAEGPRADLPDNDRQRIGFTGYVKDPESGLYYAGARYYDPAVGRFTTQDPVEGNPMRPPSLHRYLYAYANPTTYTDSTGRQVDIEDPSVAAWALGWNDEQYAEAVRVDTAAREVTGGIFYGASREVVKGAYSLGKWGARLVGKTLFDAGDAKDIVGPVVDTIGAISDAVKAGPVGFVEHEARKAVESDALIEQGRTIEAGELYGPEAAVVIGGTAGVSRLGLPLGAAERGAVASIVVESASGEAILRPMTLAYSDSQTLIGPTIGRSGFRSWDEFNAEAYRRYQQYVDEAYDDAIRAENEGMLAGNRNTRVGNFVDQTSRADMRAWLQSEGIPEGAGNLVQLNRWLRNPTGSGYVRPDVQVPGLILDATVGNKPPGTTQIDRNANYSGGKPTTVVRPSQLGGSCTVLPCSGR
jgi:RHS repeat-associated protein